eukprot:scaffold25414_cov186-Cylindrotheca_fusiformis.AAC.1
MSYASAKYDATSAGKRSDNRPEDIRVQPLWTVWEYESSPILQHPPGHLCSRYRSDLSLSEKPTE